MMKIALAAGHHNTSGGSQVEKDLVGPITAATATALRARGHEVRVITPQEGHGHFPGSLDAVARKVVEWAGLGWRADVFLEVHAESNSHGARGAFCIYPDAPGDVDTDVRDRIGPAIARGITTATGIPVRGGGVMSEKQTGVGAQGYRLGIFSVTAGMKADLTRLIVEVGAYSSAADLAIMQRPDFPGKCAAAIADGLGLLVQGRQQEAPAQVLNDALIIGVTQQSATADQCWAALVDNGAPIPRQEFARIYMLGGWLGVDMAAMIAMWAREGGRPFGGSVLQQQTRCPINIKAAGDEWRHTVSYNGERWHWFETWQLGWFASIVHVKNTHGAAGRLTVRQIAAKHLNPAVDDVEGFVRSVLEDMAYIAARKVDKAA